MERDSAWVLGIVAVVAAAVTFGCGDDDAPGGGSDAGPADGSTPPADGGPGMDGGGDGDGGTAMDGGAPPPLPELADPLAETPERDGSSVVAGGVDIGLTPSPAPVIALRTPDGAEVAVRTLGTWHVRPVEEDGDWPRIATDERGNVHVLYVRREDSALRYARWTGTEWLYRTVDRDMSGAQPYMDIALDAAGDPHVAWHDVRDGEVSYASWTGSAFLEETVASGGVGLRLGLASDGTPHLAWIAFDTARIEHAVRGDAGWTVEEVDTSSTASLFDLAMDGDAPVIAYYGAGVHVVRQAGGAWSEETVEEVEATSLDLELDAAARAHVAFVCRACADTLSLRYAREADGVFEAHEIATGTGLLAAMALDAAAAPHFAYAEAGGLAATLRYAHFDVLSPDVSPVTEMVSASAGGEVASADGRLVLQIPAGGLDADTEIGVRRLAPEDVPADVAADGPDGPVYELTPDGLTFSSPAVLTLAVPWEETFVLADENGLPPLRVRTTGSGAAIETIDVGGVEYEPLAGGATVTAELEHFSNVWTWEEEGPSPYRVQLDVHPKARWQEVFALWTGWVTITDTAGDAYQVRPLDDLPVIRKYTENTTISPGDRHEVLWRCEREGSGRLRANIVPEIRLSWATGFNVYTVDCREPLLYWEWVVAGLDVGSATDYDVDDDEVDHSSPSVPPQDGQGDHTETRGVGAERASLSGADASRLSGTDMPCGDGPHGHTLCAGSDPLPAGDYVMVSHLLRGPIPLADEQSHYQYGFVFDTNSDPSDGWSAPSWAPNDFFQGTDRWYVASYMPTGGWSLTVSDVSSGTPVEVTSAARVVLSGDALLLVVPASEIGLGPAGFRVTTFRHEGDQGFDPPHDWSGDVEPPVDVALRTLGGS